MEHGAMSSSARRRRVRQRKCRHCQQFYTPDPRNRRHQRYCSKPKCRQASKKDAQQRWLASSKGQGYFQGQDNVKRVQRWRAAHPGYSKRSGANRAKPLQDLLPSEVIENKEDSTTLNLGALQDIYLLQPAMIVGLIATLTGSTLQDDIAETSRRLVVSGRDILGSCPQKPTP
jgi:hypothetical protein